MSKLPRLSGTDIIKILCNHFHFEIIKSRGSHVTLLNKSVHPPKLLEVVRHEEVAKGTLLEIISKSGVGKQQFLAAAA